MIRISPDDRSYQGEPVHDLRDLRQMFTDLNSGNGGGDRFEFAANLGWGIHLQIEHVLMGRPTRQEDHDNGFVGLSDPGFGFGLE
jgi:hypothetical protein